MRRQNFRPSGKQKVQVVCEHEVEVVRRARANETWMGDDQEQDMGRHSGSESAKN